MNLIDDYKSGIDVPLKIFDGYSIKQKNINKKKIYIKDRNKLYIKESY